MTLPETLVRIGGAYNLGFVIFHLLFWRLFHWKRELPKLTPVNRGILQVLNLRLTFVFGIFGFVSLAHEEALIGTALGRTLLVAIALFWLLRAIEQLIFFPRHPISTAMFVTFLVGTLLYAIPAFAAT